MVTRAELLNYLDQLLEPEKCSDYCPNGLQVEGSETISTIVTGTTACQKLIDYAIDYRCDLLLVHHGYFWKDENPTIVGIKRNRLAALLKNNINLVAYHLPLDLHPEYGNNVQLAKELKFKIHGQLAEEPLVFTGELHTPMSGEQLATFITEQMAREPQHIAPPNDRLIQRIAWCAGGAQRFIEHAIKAGVDAYITGEISEQTFHIARENNIHFFAAGHHATERYGVKALGHHLANKFHTSLHYIDIDNPA